MDRAFSGTFGVVSFFFQPLPEQRCPLSPGLLEDAVKPTFQVPRTDSGFGS